MLKIDSATLPAGSVLGITSNRNAGDPNTLFVDALAGQLHNTEFRIEGCAPGLIQSIDEKQKGSIRLSPVPTTLGGGVQFDSSKPNSSGIAIPVPVVPSQGGVK